ncbi:MAG TPA: TadE/TadG family type IV pilus assembly protein [Magnetovibrio sp.]
MKSRRYLKEFVQGRRGERGATAVEFALVAPVFLLFVLGIIDLGRLFYVKNIMQYAVEQTARYAMVHPTASQVSLETYAENQAESLFSGITFIADAPGTDVVGGVNYRSITATYTFSYMMPLITVGDVPLSSSSRTPVNAIP